MKKKTIATKFIVPFFVAIAMVTFCAFAVSCDNGPSVDYSVVYGVYSCETADGEASLTLSENGYVWTTAAGTETGKYVFDGEKLSITFDGETDKAECRIENDVLTVTYKGKTYALYKEIAYTVSFVADGNTTTATVLYGRKATEPAAPEKAGYAFVGWYEDAEFTAVYDFATAVTGDKTLYARFTEAPADGMEYVVTFFDGEGNEIGKKETAGAKIFDVEGPAVEGKTFIGWWISDYQTADKLTAKYDGEAIDSDTNFYAVYKEDAAIAVSVNEKGATWTSAGVNKNYKVTVTLPDGTETEPEDVGNAAYAYDFEQAEAGDYAVNVTYAGKTYSAYYKNKALARVCKFEIKNTFDFSFTPVDNANVYYVTVKCANDSHKVARYALGTATTYNFKNCEMGAEGISFVVEAEAGGYANSVSDEFVLIRTLDDVKNVKADEQTDVLSWDAVENATGYSVEVTAGGKTEAFTVTNATKFSLKNYAAGEIAVKVTAIAKGYNASAAASALYAKKHISAPEDVKIANNSISFKAVAGATGYVVKIGNVEKTIDAVDGETVTFEFTDDCFAAGAGTYQISVKALAENATADSAFTEAVTVINGNQITAADVTYANGTATWTPVVGAVSYVIKINDVEFKTCNDGTFSTEVEFTAAGKNKVEVFFVNAESEEVSIASTFVTVYEISFDSKGGESIGAIYKAEGEIVAYPEIELKGYKFNGWFKDLDEEGYGIKYSDGTFTDTENVALTASWTANKYTIKLNYGEAGDGTEVEAQVTFGSKYTVAVEKTTDDVTKAFLGWFSLPNAQGVRYTDEDGASFDVWDYDEENRAFYAAWVDAFTFYVIDNGNSYSVSKATTADKFSKLTVPTTYNGKPVTTVEGSAFRGCTKLVTVNIPDTIKLIETGTAFLNCSSLKNVNIYETEDRDKGGYYSVDGVLIYNNENNGVEIKYFPQSRSGEYAIPEGVEAIPVAVFKSSKLTKITIPASVTRIDTNAFYYSRYLTEVVFATAKEGEAENELVISASAFGNCQALTTITLPARIAEFNSNIFTSSKKLATVNVAGRGNYTSKDGVLCNEDGTQIIYCPVGRTGAYTVPTGVNSIGDNAFKGCTKLTSITVPGYVTIIGKAAFSGCTGVTAITFEGEATDALLTIGEQAFYGCTGVTSVVLPENLATLKKSAFGNTTKLTEVTVKSGDVTFENGAFGSTDSTPKYYVTKLNIGANLGAVNITGVFGGTTLVNVTVDENNENYTVLDNVIFNKDVTSIVYYPNVTGEYTIPATVTEIGANVFEGKKITKITISGNIGRIGDSAFLNCASLATVVFEDGTKDLIIGNTAFSGTAITSITLPSRVISLGKGAFSSCKKLTSVTINGNITEIKPETFKTCTALTSVTLPEGITTIGDSAFAACTALVNVNIPASVTTLGKNAAGAMSVFTGSTKLATVNIAEGGEKYASVGGIIFEKDADGNLVTVLYCPEKNVVNGGTFTVPASVKRIETGAFAKNTGIKKVNFAEGNYEDFEFGAKAFDGCTGLTNITLPSGIKEVGEGLFAGCSNLTTVFIPNTVTVIKKDAFRLCAKLATVTFEDGGTEPLEIEDGQAVGGPPEYHGAFVGCTALKTIALPERTSKIGSYAFCMSDIKMGPVTAKKVGLTSINIPANVVSIGEYAFCAAGATPGTFTKITFSPGSKLESIGDYAFYTYSAGANYGPAFTSITFPASLKTIGGYAFGSCATLATVTFEEGSKLEKIDAAAFYSCKALTSIEIPASVKTIGADAFANALALTSVTFAPGSVIESIGDEAFSKTAITEFEFPTLAEGKKITLGSKLFNLSTTLTTVRISKSVATISDALDACSSLTNVVVDSENENVKVSNSILISKDDKNVYYVLNIADDGVLIIPEGVENIDSYSLSGKTDLTKVVIPASVRSIGQYAFSNCTNLKTIEFAKGSDLGTIGNYAFNGCAALESIALPPKVTEIGTYAFSGCKGLKSAIMEDNVATIGAYIFQDCASLTTFEFPIAITVIPNYAFKNCTSLKSVNYRGDVTVIGVGAFYGCSALESMVIPETVVTLGSNAYSGVYATGSGNVFENCTSLKSVTLPSTLTVIAGYNFRNCSSLETLDIPESVKGIATYAFAGCTKINNLVIPDGCTLGNGTATTSNNHVFLDCESLSNIVFKGSLNFIGRECFAGCTSLKTLNVQGVTGLGQDAFKGSGLVSIVLPDTLKTIYNGAFANCASLEKVIIPMNVTSIGTGVFSGCTKLSGVAVDERNTKFKSNAAGMVFDLEDLLIYCPAYLTGKLEVEEGIKLSKYAFDGCLYLTEIVLPDNLTEIYDYMFNGCSSLTTIVIPAGVTKIGNFAFAGCSSLENIVIPEKVTDIGNSAFENCTSLETFTFPAGIKKIGTKVFAGCTSIDNIEWPATVVTISNGAFTNCTSLKNITIPEKVTTIGTSTFEGCTALTTITFSSTVKTINSKAFMNSGLVEITLPANLTTVSTSVFAGCTALKSVTIPSKVTSISTSAFEGCTGLTSVTLPASVKTISKNAFMGCTALTAIVIPDNVATVSDNAFNGCTSLRSVTLGAKTTKLGNNTFENCTALTEITLPAKTVTVTATTFAGCTIKVKVAYTDASKLPAGLKSLTEAEGVTVEYVG